jgi:putative DNA primase/helicase
MSATLEVIDQMRAHLPDEPPVALVLDGRRHYFGAKKKSWYRLREERTRGGSYVVLGCFGNFKQGTFERVDVDWKGLGEAERAELKARAEAAAAVEAAARRREAQEAALGAAQLWRRGRTEGTSAYLDRKGVEGEACRYMPDGSILVPLLRYDWPRPNALRGLQRIYGGPRTDNRTGEPLPEKTFTRRFDPVGCACRLGKVIGHEVILVVEGYATGLTVRRATGRAHAVFVALNAGNLAAVVGVLRQLYPLNPIVICADDDWRTRDHAGKPDNVGRRKAYAAARTIDLCVVVFPSFGVDRQAGHTDFNDLQETAGIEVVARQLARVIAYAADIGKGVRAA